MATWVSPPTDLAATGTTTEFAAGSQSTGLKIGSLVEYDHLESGDDEYSAGSSGDVRLILLEPDLKAFGGESYGQRQYFECKWVLRANFVQLSLRSHQRTRARDVFTAISEALEGATIGDDVAILDEWVRVKGKPYSWELKFTTRIAPDGRINSTWYTADHEAFEGTDMTVTLPNDVDQPGPFRVLDDTTSF